jgi:hypothetical protein
LVSGQPQADFPSWQAQGYFLNTRRAGRKFLVVYSVFMIYLLITSAIFSELESSEMHADRIESEAILEELAAYNVSSSLYDSIEVVVKDYYEDNWDYSGSILFSFSLYSTTGYSSFTPSSKAGRVVAMVLGIPGILLCYLTVGALVNFFLRNLEKKFAASKPFALKSRNLALPPAQLTWGIVSGSFLFFLFLSAIFMLTEDWSFVDAVWFSYTTMGTIGFGDVTPDLVTENSTSFADVLYALFIVNLLLLGMTAIGMIVSMLLPYWNASPFFRDINSKLSHKHWGEGEDPHLARNPLHPETSSLGSEDAKTGRTNSLKSEEQEEIDL